MNYLVTDAVRPRSAGNPNPLARRGDAVKGIIAQLAACADVARFLDAEQAAEFLGGLNSRTVNRWAREGYIPAYPIGEGKRRLWRFLETDLTKWMLSRRTGDFSS